MSRQPHNFYYEAPVVIFLSAEDGFKWDKVDAGIAVQNMTHSFQIALAVGHRTDAKAPHGYEPERQIRML